MSSFVGELWKKVGELKLSGGAGRSSGFPFVWSEEKAWSVGPFILFEGQDYETCPDHKEQSVFRRVSVFLCRSGGEMGAARRILKNIKTMRHPRMLKYISSRESDSEIVMITEWVEPFTGESEDLEMKKWGKWSIREVEAFLRGAGRDLSWSKNNLWVTASGEVKVALFDENGPEDDYQYMARDVSGDDACLLAQLTEMIDRLVTLSTGERVNLIKKCLTTKLPEKFLKFLVLPELLRTRKLISISSNNNNNSPAVNNNPSSNGNSTIIPMEEVQFLLVKGRDLLGKQVEAKDDFMYLLSDFYGRLMQGPNPIPLTVFLLDQVSPLSPLFTPKYAQDRVFPQVTLQTGHSVPAVRDAALKALESLCGCEGALSERLISNEVLRLLARLQGDPEGPIRVRALGVLSGVVWTRLSKDLKAKICGPAVVKALGDPFSPSRQSGLRLLHQSLPLLSPQEIATKLVPAIAALLIDPDAEIRKEAFRSLENLIIPHLKRNSDSMGVANKSEERHSSKLEGSYKSTEEKDNNIMAVSNDKPKIENNPKESLTNITNIKTKTNTNTNTNNTNNNIIPTTTATTNDNVNSSKPSGKMKLGSIKKIA